jgi:hypothetical protein
MVGALVGAPVVSEGIVDADIFSKLLLSIIAA